MNVTETIDLLDVITTYDKRKITDADVDAWDEALEGLTFADCRAAVAEHYRTSGDWIKPVHVRQLVKAAQNDRQMRRPPAPNGCHRGPACCTGPLIPKPADYDELVRVAREQSRARWYDENGQHRSYANAEQPPGGHR